MVVPYKINIELSYDSTLCVYPKELKAETQPDISKSMFIAELFSLSFFLTFREKGRERENKPRHCPDWESNW